MRTIFILSDTVNRRDLKIYGGKAITPNIDRLAARGTVFDNHWCGSAPCMPARRDIMTGRLNFLEKPWSGIEPYDVTLQGVLSEKNVYSCMLTDHSHYLLRGGENYFRDFTAFDVWRGQENDPWAPQPGEHGIVHDCTPKENYKGQNINEYAANRERFMHDETLYPTPQTFTAAAELIRNNPKADNYFLWVEGFDPHEPYEAPQEYADLYGDGDYDGPELVLPEYGTQPGDYTPEELKHIRRKYLGLLTMTDKYIGKILDAIDENDMWDDTLVIFTTDHGFLQGEKDYLCKNYMHAYNEIFHIPLVVAHPQWKPERVNALTQNIDVMPTVLEAFGIDPASCRNALHGKSLLPLLSGEKQKTRDEILYGYFGKAVNITDGEYTYFRAAQSEDNMPLYSYGGMPTILRQYLGYDTIEEGDFDKIEFGPCLKWTKFPVYKIPGNIIHWGNWSQNFDHRPEFVADSRLYNIQQDYGQTTPIQDDALEQKYIALLKKSMLEHDTPPEQFDRLGI